MSARAVTAAERSLVEAKRALPNKPGVSNWVQDTGNLPDYIRRIAEHLHGRGFSTSRSIATAVTTVKRWAAGGTVRATGGPRVRPDTQAQAAAALARWDAQRAASKARTAVRRLSETDLVAADELLEAFDPSQPRGPDGRWTAVLGELRAVAGDELRGPLGAIDRSEPLNPMQRRRMADYLQHELRPAGAMTYAHLKAAIDHPESEPADFAHARRVERQARSLLRALRESHEPRPDGMVEAGRRTRGLFGMANRVYDVEKMHDAAKDARTFAVDPTPSSSTRSPTRRSTPSTRSRRTCPSRCCSPSARAERSPWWTGITVRGGRTRSAGRCGRG